MKTKIDKFLEDKRIPTFLSSRLAKFDSVSKVFPGIGLPNCKEDVVLDNSKIVLDSAHTLVDAIISTFADARELIPPAYGSTQSRYWSLLNELVYSMYYHKSRSNTVISEDGKVTLKLPTNIILYKYQRIPGVKEDEVVFKQGESLFRVYNKMAELLAKNTNVRLVKLDSMPEFKRFSSDNLPQLGFQIAFSSDGLDGLWDLTTMSMRGINSCQSWMGKYKKNLVGSIVDPFVGIIYITTGSNFNVLGTKMVKRSIVRLAFNSATKKRIIIVDRIYPEYDAAVKDKFISFIRERVNKDTDVFFGPEMTCTQFSDAYIPSSKNATILTKETYSYRDTKIPLKNELPKLMSVFDKGIQSKKTKFKNMLGNAAFTTAQTARTLTFVNQSVNQIVHSEDFKHLFKDFYRDFAVKVIESAPKDGYTSGEYMRQLCYHYMKTKDVALSKSKAAFSRKLNDYWQLDKINSKMLSKVYDLAQEEINKKIKQELKTLLGKKPAVLQLPV